MTLPSSFQLLIVLYPILVDATNTSFLPQRSRGYTVSPLRLTAPRCHHGLFEEKISCAGLGLENVPQDLFPRVEELDLSNNYIKSIYNSSFRPYHCIKKLVLHKNKITTIATGSFYSMPELEYLDLSNNGVGTIKITSGLFRFSTKLYSLIFHKTPLGNFPNDTLQWLPRLEELDLVRTEIPYINIDSCRSSAHTMSISLTMRAINHDSFKINCTLNGLMLDLRSITSIDPNVVASIRSTFLYITGLLTTSSNLWRSLFKGVANSPIQELVLMYTYVSQIDQHCFAPLRNKSLWMLEIGLDFELEKVNEMGFLSLPLLSDLVINNCTISTINPSDFDRMKGLRSLNLDHNNIQSISGNESSKWTIDLQELHLAYNNLNFIDDHCFKGLTNLKTLVLRGNEQLKLIAITPFAGLTSLKFLDISGCHFLDLRITSAPNLKTFICSDCELSALMDDIWNVFYSIKSIKHVFLRNAGILSLQIQSSNGTTSLFHGMRNLTDLNLQKNPLIQLKSGLFIDLFLLRELDLSYCKLVKIEEKAFEGLGRLETLYLQGNNLHDLPRGVLQDMEQLVSILLDHNQLRYLEIDLFTNSSNLRNLTLAWNLFTEFNRSTFQPILNTLSSIDISGNVLTCNCDLRWLPKWLSGSITLMNENDTRCSSASLEEVRNKKLVSFNPAKLCSPNIALYCSLPLAGTWIIMILVFAYRHRWFLNYKLFLLKLAVVGYQEIQDARDLDDFEYHFNIMFAEEDEDWVRNHLRRILDERLPEYDKNVYDDNDLPLGMYRLDAVHYVIENSYKTIVLISRVAVQDNWFVINFLAAADQVNEAKIENMVVIFLEDIPDDELPFVVRLYLSDRKPYLVWREEEDDRFQEYFWQQLIKMLTINLRCNNVIPPE